MVIIVKERMNVNAHKAMQMYLFAATIDVMHVLQAKTTYIITYTNIFVLKSALNAVKDSLTKNN